MCRYDLFDQNRQSAALRSEGSIEIRATTDFASRVGEVRLVANEAVLEYGYLAARGDEVIALIEGELETLR